MNFSLGRSAALAFLWWFVALGIWWLVFNDADFDFFPSFAPFGGRAVFTLVVAGAAVGLLAKSQIEVVLAVAAAFSFGFGMTFIIRPELWQIPRIFGAFEVFMSLAILFLGTGVGLIVGLLAAGSGVFTMRLPAYACIGMAAVPLLDSFLGPEMRFKLGLYQQAFAVGDNLQLMRIELIMWVIVGAIGLLAGLKRVKVVDAVVTACLLMFVFALVLGGNLLNNPMGDASGFMSVSRYTLQVKWAVILGFGAVLMLGYAAGAAVDKERNAPTDPAVQPPE